MVCIAWQSPVRSSKSKTTPQTVASFVDGIILAAESIFDIKRFIGASSFIPMQES